MHLFRKFLSLVFAVLLLGPAGAQVQPQKYGLNPGISRQAADAAAVRSMDSLLRTHPQLANTNVISAIMHDRPIHNKTGDFYLLLSLCILLGVIRVIDARYFTQLWKAFRNPALGSRQLREQLESSSLSSLLTNIFFTLTTGAYLYYLIRLFIPQHTGNIPPSLLVVMLVAGMMVIYVIKYGVMKFSGWAFKVEGITEHYIFNVFLINKIIGILLLPFTILIAFTVPAIAGPAVIVSVIVIALLLMNRYTRSWQVFGSFFQYSKFHFFMYLCASELLPLAVLMKLLVRGLIS